MKNFRKDEVKIKKGEIRYHNVHANEYDDINNLDSIKIKYLHNDFLKWLVKLNKNCMILELGGGTGSDAVHIAKSDFNLITSDISKGAITCSKEKFKKKNTTSIVNFVIADAERLPFDDQSIDCVIAVATLHHFVNLNEALREIYRCLKPDGYLIIGSEPNRWQFRFRSIKHSKISLNLLSIFNKNKIMPYETSPSDEITEGFIKKDLTKLLNNTGLTILEFNSRLYINGLINVLGINLPSQFEMMFIYIDEFMGNIPFVRNYGFHFNILCSKSKIL